jgi:hypothetical protein
MRRPSVEQRGDFAGHFQRPPEPTKPAQDLPPKGGYPEISYRRYLPKRGFPAWVYLLAATTFSFYGLSCSNRGREHYKYHCRHLKRIHQKMDTPKMDTPKHGYMKT